MKLDIRTLLRELIDAKGSDLHITVATPPRIRVDQQIISLQYDPLTPDDCKSLAYSILTDKQLLEDGKATERHEHVHDWRAQVAEVAAARGLDPAEVIAATEAMIAERHGLAD